MCKDQIAAGMCVASVTEDNEKCFYKCANSKRRATEYVHPLLDVGGDLLTGE